MEGIFWDSFVMANVSGILYKSFASTCFVSDLPKLHAQQVQYNNNKKNY